MTKIEWGEPVDDGHGSVKVKGRISDLVVAEVFPDRSRKGGRWWVTVHLVPLPRALDAMTYESKASERQAKATAQRILNAFTKILNGEPEDGE